MTAPQRMKEPDMSLAKTINLSSVPTHTELLALAPTILPSYWEGRFTAENERRLLADFTSLDQSLLRRAYGVLLGLFEEFKGHYTEAARSRNVIQNFVSTGESRLLVSTMQQFGLSTAESNRADAMERVIHDLRGGAFQALACRLDLFNAGIESRGLQSLFFLVRDHLKMMRNAVSDLDVERFILDTSPQNHDAQLLVEKWSHVEFHGAGTPVQVVLNSRYTGTLCESCLEFSTLDRIIYNLMNNAAKYTDNGIVHFYILPVPEITPASVRFVFCNSVDSAHRELLREKFGDSLSDIFWGGFTTGGHGLGLRICADFCGQAYGLSDFPTARESGYFGAEWIRDQFTAWFHWPIGHTVT
jgi:signal transduction histidine kinase